MSDVITVCLVILGLINFFPVLGVLSASKMEKAYSVTIGSRDMEILMRHRALLFGIVGGFILYAAFVPVFHVAAMVMAGVSMAGFVVLAWLVGDYNESIVKVNRVDLVGIGILLVTVVLKFFS